MNIIEQAKAAQDNSPLMTQFLHAKARYLASIRFNVPPNRFSMSTDAEDVLIDGVLIVTANLKDDKLEFSTADRPGGFEAADWEQLFIETAS